MEQWHRVLQWSGVHSTMQNSARQWTRFCTWCHHTPQVHSLPLSMGVAVWLTTLMHSCTPPSLRTYTRQINFQASILGFKPILNTPPIIHTLQALYNYHYQHHPMQASQAPDLRPQDLEALLAHPDTEDWMKILWNLSDLTAARIHDLLGPLSLQDAPTAGMSGSHTGMHPNPEVTVVMGGSTTPFQPAILTIYHHKTSGRGLKQPPLKIPLPPHPVVDALRQRLTHHPTLAFPECRSSRHALLRFKQLVPQARVHLYSARNAALKRFGTQLPDHEVQRLAGHKSLATTRNYLRNTLTHTQQQSVNLVSSLTH